MALGGLLALLDDVTALLDDIAAMAKVAGSKTAGIVGDDLALNAGQVVGLAAKRELPVIYAVAKGSLLNKCILVPAAIAISLLIPWAILPLLMIGGAYLCFEGVEKILHKHKHDGHHPALEVDNLVALEQTKIKGAIRTDFILSAEIIAITLGTVATEELLVQVGVLSVVAVLMTIVVYGLVAIIVKMDDVGFHLAARPSPVSQKIGKGIVAAAPIILKIIGVLGMLAMFLVGGGIILHGLPFLETWLHDMTVLVLPEYGIVTGIVLAFMTIVIGVITGILSLLAVGSAKAVVPAFRKRL